MRTLEASNSLLLLVDFQTRLMPAIEDGAVAVENARRLLVAAALLGVPRIFTEKIPRSWEPTAPDLHAEPNPVVAKMTFDALRAREFPLDALADCAVVVAGCEAHVCVLQTVLSALDQDRRVFVVADATGSRTRDNKKALNRMERHGAEIVTTEMVLFEWLGASTHPHFRDIAKLIR